MSCPSFSDHGAMLSQGPRTKVWTWPCFSGAAVVFGRTWQRPGQCIHIFIYMYIDGLKLRMTFWKSPGVSEKLPFRRVGPKSHVFELFFRLENLE